jgi:hypothetical protein
MGYSDEAVAAAQQGLRLAWSLYDTGAIPFDGSPGRLLRKLRANSHRV